MNSIAVVISACNPATRLYAAVASVVWQLAPEDELIVVHNAPNEPPTTALRDEFPNRILWVRHYSRHGGAVCRNRAMASCRADWVIFLEAEDVLAPFALQSLRKIAADMPANVQVVAGSWHRIRDGKYYDYVEPTAHEFERILRANPAPASAAFVRRLALATLGRFDERIDFEEDWDLWLKIHERFGRDAFSVTDKPFSYLRDRFAERHWGPRRFTVDGVPVREYYHARYGVQAE